MRRWLMLLLGLLLAAPAEALILASGDGQGNTTPPADDPGWNQVVRIGGPSGVYLGNGWMLTADHVLLSAPDIGGVLYPIVPGSIVQLLNPPVPPSQTGTPADLKVFRISPYPSMPLVKLRSTTPNINTDVTIIARGLSRGDATSWDSGTTIYYGFEWGATGGKRWGTNRVSGTEDIGTLAFTTSFSQSGTTHEAQGADGDSGGAVFIKKNGTTWELAGILLAVGTYPNQPAATALYGNATYSADISEYRDQIITLTRPACADEIDNDGDLLVDFPNDPGCASELDASELLDEDQDGVVDTSDNCRVDANADQLDTNQDGYGNLCDADYDGDGIVGVFDFGIFRSAYGTSLGNPGYDADLDADGNGFISTMDFGLLKSQYGDTPGPSGLGCAGTVPCP